MKKSIAWKTPQHVVFGKHPNGENINKENGWDFHCRLVFPTIMNYEL